MAVTHSTNGILDRDLPVDNFGRFAAGSLALHAGIVVAIAIGLYVQSKLHRDSWGDAKTGGAIEATLVSSAPALPLPSDQPPSDNVLATETPSTAPAPLPQESSPVADALPLENRDFKPKKAPPKQEAQPKPEIKPKPNQLRPQQKTQPTPETNRAQYGEQAGTHIARATQSPTATQGSQVAVQGGDFGSRFPWYVDTIKRRVASMWNRPEVDPHTPPGSRVYLVFNVNRDGSPSRVQVERSSNSPTLDTSCLRAVQRVDSFGPLPAGYNGGSLSVSYYCEY